MELFINNRKIELSSDTVIGISKTLMDANDLNAIFVDFTKTIEVPRTPKNDEIFNNSFELDRIVIDKFSGVEYFNASKKIQCRIEDNSNILIDGYAILNNATIDKYNITVYGEMGNIFRSLKEVTIDDIDKEVALTANLVADSFQKETLEENSRFENYINLDEFNLTIPDTYKISARVKIVPTTSTTDFIHSTPPSLLVSLGYEMGGVTKTVYQWSPYDQFRSFVSPSKNADETTELFDYEIGLNDGYGYLTINGETFDAPRKSVYYELPANSTFIGGKYYYLKIYNTLGNLIANYQPIENDDPTKNFKYAFKNLIEDSIFPTYIGYSDDGDTSDLLDVIGFCSTHQGLYEDFDSTRNANGDFYMDVYNNRYDGLSEHTIKEFRSYYQQPYVFIRPLLLNLQKYVNENLNYNLIYDDSWFRMDNPYWSQLIMMGKVFGDRDDEHVDGPSNNFTFQEVNTTPNYIGFNEKECLGELDKPIDLADFMITPNGQPWQFNMPDVFTIEKPADVPVLRSNLHFRWQFQPYDDDMQPQLVKDINGLYLVTKWYIPNATAKNDPYKMYPNSMFGMKLTFKVGNVVEKYGYYGDHPLQDIVDNWLSDCKEKIQLGKNGKYDYPQRGLLETSGPEGFTQYLGWPLGIETMGFVLNSDEKINIEVEFYSTIPQLMFSINDANIRKIDDWCLKGLFIPTCYIDPFRIDEQFPATCEGVVFESDYDSRRSGATISLKKILEEDFKPIDLLIKYAKMFRLYFDVDYVNRTITLTDRYFDDYKIVDWSNKVDYKNMTVKPIINDDEFIQWGYEESDIKYAENYKMKYGVEYGDHKISTGIDTLNTTYTMFDEFPISLVSQEYYPNRYQNTTSLSTESCICAIDNNQSATSASRQSVYGSFYFWNTPQEISSYFDFQEVSSKGGTYLVTDDTYDMVATNEYYYSGKNGNYVECDKTKFPFVDTECMNYFGDSQKIWGCQWSQPRLKYNNKVHYSEAFPYKNPYYIIDIWKDYLSELYNANNKQVTCNVRLTTAEFSQFKFNTFVKIDNCLFVVVKIENFNGNGLTQVTLNQITNPNNFKSKFNELLNEGRSI